MQASSMEEKLLEIKSLTNEVDKQNRNLKIYSRNMTMRSRGRETYRNVRTRKENKCRIIEIVKGNQKQIEKLEEKQRVETEVFLTKNKELQDAIEEKQVKLEEIKTNIEAMQQTNISLQTNFKREREMSESKTQEVLSTQMNYLNDEFKQMNTESVDLKQLFKTLMKQEETAKEEIKTQMEILKKELQQYNRRKEIIDERLNHVENEYQILSTDARKRIKTETLEEKQRAEIDKYLEQLMQEKREQAKEIENKTICFEKLVETNLSLQKDLQDERNMRVSLLEEKVSQKELHKNEIEKMNKDFEELRQIQDKEYERMKLSLYQEKNKNEEYCKQLVALNYQQRLKDEMISQLTDEKKSLATDVDDKKTQLETLQVQLELATRKTLHETKKTALLIFQEREEKSLRKEVDQNPGNVSKIGGVFDIGYKNGIYQSEINSNNIDRILSFFSNEGVLKSRNTEFAV